MVEVQNTFDFVDYIPGVDKGLMLHITVPQAPCISSRDMQHYDTNKVVAILSLFEGKGSLHSESSITYLSRAQALALAGRLIDFVDVLESQDSDDASVNGKIGCTFGDLTITEWSILFLHFFQGMPVTGCLRSKFIELNLIKPCCDGETLGSALPPSIR